MRKPPSWMRILLLPTLGAAMLLILNHIGAAQASHHVYDISWWTVDAGGITLATGNGYSLGGTAAQPDAGVLAGGGYSLGGGFWRGGVPSTTPSHRIHLPLLLRN